MTERPGRSSLNPLLMGICILGLLAASVGHSARRIAADPASFRPEPSAVAHPGGFPEIGKWMIAPELTYAHWMGEKVRGKGLREPINVIIEDAYAAGEAEAVERLLSFCAQAGFPSRPGHSSGYYGWLGGRLFSQTPSRSRHSLSDEPFEFSNNHGRFFGPVRHGGKFYMIGAMSREKVAPFTRSEHEYVSFIRARDALARRLVRKSRFVLKAYVPLDNAILDDPALGTGDHDGLAVWLAAPETL